MATNKTRLTLKPRNWVRPYLQRTEDRACLVVHRRGGKSFGCLQDLILKCHTHTRKGLKSSPLRYGYFAPTQAQAKKIAWSYLKTFTHQIPGVIKNESELWIRFQNGAEIGLYSGENYERARGLYFDGVVLDEYADIPPDAWESVIEPCLLDYKGWATFVGTPKGKNAFWRVYQHSLKDPEWFSLCLKASESGLIPSDQLARMKATRESNVFEREFECSFSSDIPGTIYAKEVEDALRLGHVCDFEPDRGPVWTTWDLGSPQNSACIYWQISGMRRTVIDCDISASMTLEERVGHMQAKGYDYGGHLLPHDSAARQPNGLTFAEELRKAGLSNVQTIPRTHDKELRINATKKAFPNIWFRDRQTTHLRDALSQYHYKEATDGTGWITNKISHGWESHPSDAFSMLAEAELHDMLTDQQSHAKRRRRPRINAGTGY